VRGLGGVDRDAQARVRLHDAWIASCLVATCAASAPAQVVNPYATQRAAAIRECEKISPSEYQTGLIFNPKGYQSMYTRSACLQRAAELYRDRDLCDQVKRRWALFSSSWGYSKGNCRKLVAEGEVRDSVEIERQKAAYRAGPVRLTEIRLERNGNGRDVDVIPTFAPGYASGYLLRLELITGARAVTIDSSGYHLSGGDNIRGYIRSQDIRARVPEFEFGRPWRVRATLILAVGFGGQSGMWSDAFLARRFPVSERSQSLERVVSF
jgi:hypothetical protein